MVLQFEGAILNYSRAAEHRRLLLLESLIGPKIFNNPLDL
jgi:hypothetical protein